MSRIRTIKPEFPQSESMGRVSREARLLFILLWTLADDSGKTRGSSRALASLLFPYDDDVPGKIDGWLDDLEAQECILRYQADGKSFIQILNWSSHQKIDHPSKSKYPDPREGSRNPREGSRRLATSSDGTKDLRRERREREEKEHSSVRAGQSTREGSRGLASPAVQSPAAPDQAVVPYKKPKETLEAEQLETYHAALAAFESSKKAKALIYQDKATTAREMKNLKMLVKRAHTLSPEAPLAFLLAVMARFKQLVNNGKLKDKASWLPSGLCTSWIWNLVLEGMQSEPTEEEEQALESVKGLFAKKAAP